MGSKLEAVLIRRPKSPGRALIGIVDNSRTRAMREKLPPPPSSPALFKGTTSEELEKQLLERNK